MRAQPSTLAVLDADNTFAAVRRAVAEQARARGRALDIVDIGSGNLLRGSGGGRFLRILEDHARSYVGIEPSWRMLRDVDVDGGAFRRLRDARQVRSTGEDLPLPAASCDVVLCLAVLDHCTDPARVLARSREVLRPGGVLVLALQNHARWYRAVLRRVARRWDERHAAGDHHHHHFDPRSAIALLHAHGFRSADLVELGFLLAPGLRRLADLAFAPLRLLPGPAPARALGTIDRAFARALPGRGQHFVVTARAA